MLRVEMHDAANAFLVKLQGRFTGDYAEHIQSLVSRSTIRMRLIVDLTDVTFVDSAGERVLQWFKSLGGKFVATNSYALDICDRLHLPFAPARSVRTFGANILKNRNYSGASSENAT